MYSAKGDTVLDPFLGTGTTTAAAIASSRNSTGYEIDPSLENVIHLIKDVVVEFSKEHIRRRLTNHIEFVVQWLKTKGGFKHDSDY